jgi:hypothetical protein
VEPLLSTLRNFTKEGFSTGESKMPGQRKEGLLGMGMARGEGAHLYHATKPAVVAHTDAEAAQFEAQGYGTEYIPQEYPKYDAASGRTFKSAEEEAASKVAE